MSPTSSNLLKPSLNSVTPEVKHYVTKLETENLKLQKKVADLQVKHLSSQNRVSALEKVIKKFHFPKDLTDKELNTKLKDLFEKLAPEYGYSKSS